MPDAEQVARQLEAALAFAGPRQVAGAAPVGEAEEALQRVAAEVPVAEVPQQEAVPEAARGVAEVLHPAPAGLPGDLISVGPWGLPLAVPWAFRLGRSRQEPGLAPSAWALSAHARPTLHIAQR